MDLDDFIINCKRVLKRIAATFRRRKGSCYRLGTGRGMDPDIPLKTKSCHPIEKDKVMIEDISALEYYGMTGVRRG